MSEPDDRLRPAGGKPPIEASQHPGGHLGERGEILLNEAPFGMYLVDSQLRVIQANRQAEAVSGQNREQLGQSLHQIMARIWPEEVADQIVGIFRRTLTTGEPFHDPEMVATREDTEVTEYYDWRILRVSLPDGQDGVACYFYDITEHVRDKVALAESREKYQTLFQSIDEGFCILEIHLDENGRPRDYRFLEINPAFERQTGLVNAAGKTILELAPDVESFWIEFYGRVSLTGEAARLTRQSLSLERWFDAYAFRIGEPAEHKVAVLFSDISARKKAEEALKVSLAEAELEQRRLATVLEALPAGVAIADATGRITHVNHAFIRIWGGPPDTRSQDDFARYRGRWLHNGAPVRPEDWALARAINTGEVVPGDLVQVERFDGTGATTILNAAAPIRDAAGVIIGGVVAEVDLTGQMKAETALRESEERFRTLADNISQLAWIADENGKVFWYNRRWFEYTGSTREEMQDQGAERVLHPDHIDRVVGNFHRAFATGEPWEDTFPIRARDGQYKWFLSRALPIRNENGKVVRWFGTNTDIDRQIATERELANAKGELERYARELEKRVEDRTAELREQTTRLRHLAAELSTAEQRERKRLAALLHDNLQQLLAASLMQLNKARKAPGQNVDGPAVDQACDWLREAIEAARFLTHQLRPPALYEDGLIAALYGLAQDLAQRHGLTVHIAGDDGTARVSDDLRAFLYDAVRELLFNVGKHAETSEAWVKVSAGEGILRLQVSDQGKGFPMEGTAPLKRPASGFGLFSIRERVLAIGGKLSLCSNTGAGTTVLLELPLNLEAAVGAASGAAPAAAPVAPALNGGGIRILVVDDHAIVRQGLTTLLTEDERFLVVGEAGDGLAAIEAVERHYPDVILMDVNMPRMNGLEAAREIHRRHPEVVIIGLSVQDDETTARAMREAGASAFLSKAGDSARMVATILDLARPSSKHS